MAGYGTEGYGSWSSPLPVCSEDVEEINARAFHTPLFQQPELYADLPEAVLSSVFEHLNVETLQAVLLSCKRWRNAARASAAKVVLRHLAHNIRNHRPYTVQVCWVESYLSERNHFHKNI